MNKIIEFPQCQHHEFKRLVFKTVLAAAREQGLGLEDYISRIYYAGENPHMFSSRSGLELVYKRFRDLVENASGSDLDADEMSVASKTYLCFRIYLHSACLERHKMPESDAELYLQNALQEYFLSEEKVLSAQDEIKMLRYLKRARKQARVLPD